MPEVSLVFLDTLGLNVHALYNIRMQFECVFVDSLRLEETLRSPVHPSA